MATFALLLRPSPKTNDAKCSKKRFFEKGRTHLPLIRLRNAFCYHGAINEANKTCKRYTLIKIKS